MSTVEFHPLAELELSEAVSFYDKHSSKAGDALTELAFQMVDQIVLFPGAGRVLEGRIHCRVLPDPFPFSLLYAFSEDRLFILAVMHHKRHPESWKDRIKDIPF